MKTFLHLEALMIFAGAIWLNIHLDGNWWMFVLFAVLPDVALLAYIWDPKGKRWPSMAYNLLHLYGCPVVLGLLLWDHHPVYMTGWIAHIAIDRVLGYGLKSRNDFKITHLQRAAE